MLSTGGTSSEADRRDTSTTVPALVARALGRCSMQYEAASRALASSQPCGEEDYRRLAQIAEREARWFRVLHRWVYSAHSTVPLVFGQAAVRAESSALDEARHWTDGAEQRHTHDARREQEDQR